MNKTNAYSAVSATSPLASTTISRRDPTERDVKVDILYCGICHSDLHYARNEWRDVMPTVYPCVPGYESSAASRWARPLQFKAGTSWALAAWSIRTGRARIAATGLSNTARTSG